MGGNNGSLRPKQEFESQQKEALLLLIWHFKKSDTAS